MENQKEVYNIINKWFMKEYSRKLSHSTKNGVYTELSAFEDMAMKLGNPLYETYIRIFSCDDYEDNFNEEIKNNRISTDVYFKFVKDLKNNLAVSI